MKTFVILRRSAWADAPELGVAAEESTRVGNEEMPDDIRWIRSYVLAETDGRLGTACIWLAARKPYESMLSVLAWPVTK